MTYDFNPRSRSGIERFLSRAMVIRIVRLNRGGVPIGALVRFPQGTPWGRMFYLTIRDPDHFYRLGSGYAVDKPTLKRMVNEELDEYRSITGDQNARIRVLVWYRGKTVGKLLLSEVEPFFERDNEIDYTKNDGIEISTYGNQLSLPEADFGELMKERVIQNV